MNLNQYFKSNLIPLWLSKWLNEYYQNLDYITVTAILLDDYCLIWNIGQRFFVSVTHCWDNFPRHSEQCPNILKPIKTIHFMKQTSGKWKFKADLWFSLFSGIRYWWATMVQGRLDMDIIGPKSQLRSDKAFWWLVTHIELGISQSQNKEARHKQNSSVLTQTKAWGYSNDTNGGQ